MKTFISLFLFCATIHSIAQNDPVTWAFSAKKIDDKKFEIHMTASMLPGWHLYSQLQPEDAIAIPTGFTINNNPLLTLDGKINEVGAMIKFKDEKLGLSAYQYSGKVDFVQVVTLKAKVKTNLTGSVEYQTCDDKKCLPPKMVSFTVPIK